MSTVKNSGTIYLLTFVASLGGLLFGYDTAVISGAVGSLNSFFVTSLSENSPTSAAAIFQYKIILTISIVVIFILLSSFIFKFFKKSKASAIVIALLLIGGYFYYTQFFATPNVISENLKNSILGFMVSSALVGCIIGGSLGDKLANSLGRRNGLVLAAILFIISASGSGYPDTMNIFGGNVLTSFIVYRIIGGIGVGLASMLSPLYIAEMAPAEIRGRLVSFNQLAIVGGMLVVYAVNTIIVSGQEEAWINSTGWRYMFLSENVPAVIFLIFLIFVPKTPRFQVMKGNEENALEVLSQLNGPEEAPVILSNIKNSFNQEKSHWLSFGGLVVIIGLLLSIFQQFVGINVVLYYAPEIFKGMGVSAEDSYLQTILVGVINLAFTILAITTVDKYGRKKLMLIGSIAMAISMIGLGFSLFTQSVGIFALLAMLLYIAAFAMSWGPVTWVLLSEIFPNKIKGVMAVAVAIQWLANLAVSWTFPMMDKNAALTEHFHHGFAYWVYGVMAIISAVVVWKLVPETKGKSLEDIENIWLKK